MNIKCFIYQMKFHNILSLCISSIRVWYWKWRVAVAWYYQWC